MGNFVCMGAMLQCTFGMAPSTLTVIIPTRPKCGDCLMANITDYVPLVNIMTFGMCQSLSNPTVSAATSAAMGVLTPMPCIPVVSAPWSPGGQVKVGGSPALINNAKCMCSYGGQISVTNPSGSMSTQGK